MNLLATGLGPFTRDACVRPAGLSAKDPPGDSTPGAPRQLAGTAGTAPWEGTVRICGSRLLRMNAPVIGINAALRPF